MSNSISHKAVLVNLSMSHWTARKKSKEANTAIIREFCTTREATNTTKALIDRKYGAQIRSIQTAAKLYHREVTLAWMDEGARILPTQYYTEYVQKMNDFKHEMAIAVEHLISVYQIAIKEAAHDLGELANFNDYPSVQELRDKYDISIAIFPIPEAADFRLTVGDYDVEQMKADMQSGLNASLKAAVQEVWDRVNDVVGHLHEFLADDTHILRDAILHNVSALVDALPKLNVTGDRGIEQMVDELKTKVLPLDLEACRRNGDVRKQAASETEKVLKQMQFFMGS